MKLDTYIRNPERYFDSPPDVLDCTSLSRKEKLLLLASWKNDLLEQQHANEENMPRQQERDEASSSTAEKLTQVIAVTRLLEEQANR